MKLRKTEVRYEMTDPSGYDFTIVCQEDAEFKGWDATVVMHTSGMKTPEDAIKHLRHSAEAFLSHLKELK